MMRTQSDEAPAPAPAPESAPVPTPPSPAAKIPAHFTDAVLTHAFFRWYKPMAMTKADQALAARNPVSLRMAREALLISTGEMGKRMAISRSGYHQLETRAESGEISIKRLSEAAAALDCECVVIVRPKDGATFISRVWTPLLARALKTRWMQSTRTDGSKIRLGAALGTCLNLTFANPAFRREQRWTRRWVDACFEPEPTRLPRGWGLQPRD